MASIAVAAASAVLVHGPQDTGQVIIANVGANPVYLGEDATVTSATGVPLAAGATLSALVQWGGKSVYAICASAQSSTVNVITL